MLIPAWFQRFQTIRAMFATFRFSTLTFATLILFATQAISLDGRSSEPPDSPEHVSASDDALWRRIDGIIESYHRGPMAPVVGNSEFVRRVYLDLIGRIPTAEEVTAFFQQSDEMAGSSTDQVRARLIDDLLARDDFSQHYAKVLEIMFTERRTDEKITLQEFRNFIRGWLAERRPLNELCMEILAADGTGKRYRPAASFFLNRAAEPNLLTRDVGRIFFGRNVQCAQCHDHPLVDDYHQSEYFGILSFVNRSFLFQDEKRGIAFVGEKADGNLEFISVFRPEDGKKVAETVLPSAMAMDSEPSFVDDLDGYVVPPSKDSRAIPRHSRRQQLAVLATHPKNHSFNRNLANRLWAQMLGIGIVHPVDAHHGGNPPISSALLRILADELVASNYDLRSILKQIAMSHAYQRSQTVSDLDSWAGPSQGTDGLRVEIQQMTERVQQFATNQQDFEGRTKSADEAVRIAQAKVQKVQNDIEDQKKELQRLRDELGSKHKQLTDVKSKQASQQSLLASLRTAAEESAKAAKLIPMDEELSASQALLEKRVASIAESSPQLDATLSEVQGQVTDLEREVEDQRSRVIALGSRRVAMSEFVAEARGVQRNVQSEHQVMLDQITDWTRQAKRCQELLDYLELRDQARTAATAENGAEPAELVKKLEIAEEKLIASWRRAYALGQIRGLTPEQLASATFYALELYRPAEQKVRAEWQTNLADKGPTEEDLVALRKRIGDAVAERQWEVEDHLVPRFSSPGGTPQDGFFATTDQALTLQNDATYQSWLQSSEGTLLHRLKETKNDDEVVDSIYLSVLSRSPDSEERKQARDYLAQWPEERSSVLQELVWGLLASTEFRFVP